MIRYYESIGRYRDLDARDLNDLRFIKRALQKRCGRETLETERIAKNKYARERHGAGGECG